MTRGIDRCGRTLDPGSYSPRNGACGRGGRPGGDASSGGSSRILVGSALFGDIGRPFIWHEGTMTDLNTLIDPGEGWFIEDSADINDAGMIAASARNIDGRRRAVLLTPVQAHCPADFNADGAADSGDFFAFLGAFFAGSAGADFDNNGHADSADFFGYITAYFQGC